ncbi:MAG: right-handed parallel beta-helix repeat-containing protein [Planctomycetes bacterium]|nr:right-handed parallel beta-helix repeat-containing protein [Planctomycetota bacterium]
MAALFENSNIDSNQAEEGGGLAMDGASPRFAGCSVLGNAANLGAGFLIQYRSAVTLEGCRLSGNRAESWGGGIFSDHSTVSLANTAMTHNSANNGSAVYGESTRLILDRSTVTGNRFGNGWPGGAVVLISPDPTSSLSNSIIWGNSDMWGNLQTGIAWRSGASEQVNLWDRVSYSCVEGLPAGQPQGPGNLDADPLFCGWNSAELHIHASAPGPGAGTAEDPYPDLAHAFALGHPPAIDPGSPCLGAGEGGTNMGADLGTCESLGEVAALRLGPGTYPTGNFPFEGVAAITGSGWERTVLTGTVQLDGGSKLAGVTVTGGGELGGVHGDSLEIRDARIARNATHGVMVSGNSTLSNCILSHNSNSGVLVEGGSSLKLDRCTVAFNEASGVELGSGANAAVKSSIIWGNGAAAFSSTDSATATYSCIEGGKAGTGNLDLEPRFCGWPSSEVQVDASVPAGGNGSSARPFKDLASALTDGKSFRFSLASNSPCLGKGEGGTDMGAAIGTCENAQAFPRLSVRIAAGHYDLKPQTLLSIDLLGSGRKETEVVISPQTSWDDRPLRLLGSALRSARLEGYVDLAGYSISGELENVDVAGNVRCSGGGKPRLQDCFIRGQANRQDVTIPGAVVAGGAQLELTRCTIAGGTAEGLRIEQGSMGTLTNCIIWRNANGSIAADRVSVVARFSCIEGGWEGEGNLATDPLFCGPGGGSVVVRDSTQLQAALESIDEEFDYGLRQDSPCISTGLGGARMGADIGLCPGGMDTRRAIVLEPGSFIINRSAPLTDVVVRGSARDAVVLSGASIGNGVTLEDLTIRSGYLSVAPFARASIRGLHIEQSPGAGILCSSDSSPEISETLIALSAGAGILCERGSRPRIARVTITANVGPGIVAREGARAAVDSSIVWANRGGAVVWAAPSGVEVAFSCLDTQTVLAGEGNINAAPRFCGWDTADVSIARLEDMATLGARHGFGLASDSPCLGKGRGGIDMGAPLPACVAAGPERLVVRLPAGEFDTSQMSALPRFIDLRGAGRGSTTLNGFFEVPTAVTLASLTVVGGVSVWYGQAPEVRDCDILGNLSVGSASSPILSGCTIRSNYTSFGVVCGPDSTPLLDHCKIVEGIAGVICDARSRPVIQNSIVWNNPAGAILLKDPSARPAVRYSCIQGTPVWPGPGNINANPIFCGWPSATAYVDASAEAPGDGSQERPYTALEPALEGYLLELSPSSPCIGRAEGGGNIGGPLDICDRTPVGTRTVQVAPGEYGPGFLPPGIILKGSGPDTTRFASIAAAGGSAVEDVSMAYFEGLSGSPVVRRCEVSGNFRASGATIIVEDSELKGVWLMDTSWGEWKFGIPLGEAIVRRCVLRGSDAGITISGLPARIEHTLIEGSSGVAITIDGCGSRESYCANPVNPVISDCRIIANGNGGIYVNSSSPRIERCFIADNLGPGVSLYNASPRIVRCTIVGNSGRTGASGVDRECGAPSAPRIVSSVIWGNAGEQVDFSGLIIGDLPTVTGSILEGRGPDPLFIGWGGRSAVYVGAPDEEAGDGTEANPFFSLDLALTRVHYSYAVQPTSPVFTYGPGGTEVGAVAEVDGGPRSSKLEIRVAPGQYDVGMLNVAGKVSIIGSGQDVTVLEGGSILGLRSEARLAQVTILRGEVVIGTDDAPIIEDSSFRECANAIYLRGDARPRIIACRLFHNNISISGYYDCGDATGPAPDLLNCEIVENGLGIALSIYKVVPRIDHCTIANNTVNLYLHPVAIEVTRSIVWGGSIEAYREAPRFLDSLVGVDPRFRAPPSVDGRGTPDPGDDIRIPGDYRLLPSSPAIDLAPSGADIDLDGNPRPCYGAFDAGAHEYCGPEPPNVHFRRGDANEDGDVDITDAIRVLEFLFLGGVEISCHDAADIDDSGAVDISDPIYLLQHLFLRGDPPLAPFPGCGGDPTADVLPCPTTPSACR